MCTGVVLRLAGDGQTAIDCFVGRAVRRSTAPCVLEAVRVHVSVWIELCASLRRVNLGDSTLTI